MSDRRRVWETLSTLSALLDQLEQEVEVALQQQEAPSDEALAQIKEELRRLGKTQFKMNALLEAQGGHWEEVLTALHSVQEEQDRFLDAMEKKREAAAQEDLLKTILPALDGVERAIAGGRRYLSVRDRAADAVGHSQEKAILVSPADRAVLAGWLEGLRLVRERLLGVLEAGGVTPVQTVGHPFDPYQHVAVGTAAQDGEAPGTIVAEERRGYRTPNKVLRYAEVIVCRPRAQEGKD